MKKRVIWLCIINLSKKKYKLLLIYNDRRIFATQLVEHGLLYEQVMIITGYKKLTPLQKYIKSDANINEMLEVGRRIRN